MEVGMKVLHVVPSLGYNSAARQIQLLGPHLARKLTLEVCALEGRGPWTVDLEAAGIRVHCLEWRRPLDPLPLWRLRRLLRDFNPDRIHVWRLAALRPFVLL